MGKYYHMVAVLSTIALVSGLSLGWLNGLTYQRVQNNILKFKKIPAVADIYEIVNGKSPQQRAALEESLLAEKRFLDIGEKNPYLFFIIKKNGKPYAVALENFGQGYGGPLGVMIGFELKSGNLVGIAISTLSETPGVGSRAKEDFFTSQFQGMKNDSVFKVKKDDGDIDAISGATISSRAVSSAVATARDFYNEHRQQIIEAVKAPEK